MKRFNWIYPIVIGLLMIIPLIAFADDPTQPVDVGQFWMQLVQFLSSLKGATVIGVAVLLSQLALTFFRTSLADFAGVWKLVIVTGLSVVVTIIGNLQSGMGFLGSLLAGTTIAAIQVFINEVLKHFGKVVNLPN